VIVIEQYCQKSTLAPRCIYTHCEKLKCQKHLKINFMSTSRHFIFAQNFRELTTFLVVCAKKDNFFMLQYDNSQKIKMFFLLGNFMWENKNVRIDTQNFLSDFFDILKYVLYELYIIVAYIHSSQKQTTSIYCFLSCSVISL
jgi:hypothetical protein